MSVWVAVATLPAASAAVATKVKAPAVLAGMVALAAGIEGHRNPIVRQCQAGDAHVIGRAHGDRDRGSQVRRIGAQEQVELRRLGVCAHGDRERLAGGAAAAIGHRDHHGLAADVAGLRRLGDSPERVDGHAGGGGGQGIGEAVAVGIRGEDIVMVGQAHRSQCGRGGRDRGRVVGNHDD